MAATPDRQATPVPRLAQFLRYGGGKLRDKRARLADWADVDEETVIRWEKGKEAIPDKMIADLAERFGVSVSFLMHWDGAPRSAIPEHWRQPIAKDQAERVARFLPGECEQVLHWIELRLLVGEDLDVESVDVPRLQRLRAALLVFLSEPLGEDE